MSFRNADEVNLFVSSPMCLYPYIGLLLAVGLYLAGKDSLFYLTISLVSTNNTNIAKTCIGVFDYYFSLFGITCIKKTSGRKFRLPLIVCRIHTAFDSKVNPTKVFT